MLCMEPDLSHGIPVPELFVQKGVTYFFEKIVDKNFEIFIYRNRYFDQFVADCKDRTFDAKSYSLP